MPPAPPAPLAFFPTLLLAPFVVLAGRLTAAAKNSSILAGRTVDTAGMTVIPSQFGILSNLLDAAELRQRVISQNIANVNTPGYHRQDVAFEEALARQLIQGGRLDAGGQRPDIYEVEGLPTRADGNNVDIDKEMGQLNKNALLYQTYAQVLASKMAMMRSAITGQ